MVRDALESTVSPLERARFPAPLDVAPKVAKIRICNKVGAPRLYISRHKVKTGSRARGGRHMSSLESRGLGSYSIGIPAKTVSLDVCVALRHQRNRPD